MRKALSVTILTGAIMLFNICYSIAATVYSEGHRIYIEDRTGELWDVTEAKERGFKPQKFKYGLGKSAIKPLGDKDLGNEQFSERSDEKVLGISVGNESHAYSIERLSYHEIANTTIAGKKIAAGY